MPIVNGVLECPSLRCRSRSLYRRFTWQNNRFLAKAHLSMRSDVGRGKSPCNLHVKVELMNLWLGWLVMKFGDEAMGALRRCQQLMLSERA